MKQHHSIFPPAASLACALILMLAACTSDALDELPPAGTDPDAHPLTITVSDGGMYATGQTRAQERGYSTVFTEGDCIGLYVVKDGTLEVKNLCLTLQGGKWTLPAGASQLLYSPDKSYHAYYPYRKDGDLNGKVLPGDEDFFKSVVKLWFVNRDQSTYAQYTASDLMTARGVYNNHTLSFAMEHRMSLLILQVPATKYTYTEKIDGREISKSYYRYTAVISENSYWQENPCTARLLLNTTDPTHLNPEPYEYYYNGTKETFNLKYSQLNLQPGKYTVHTLDDSKVTEESRSLKAGDYYMQDGSILPGVLCQCFQNVSGLVERELPGSALGREAHQQPLCTEHKARAAHSLLRLRRKGFPFSAAHANQCDHCKISLQYAKICVSVSPVSGGRRSTTSCAPVSAAACTFSAKPPAAPPSLVTRYRIWNCVINALFSARLNGPCMAMMFRCGTLAASQAAMPSGVGRTRG